MKNLEKKIRLILNPFVFVPLKFNVYFFFIMKNLLPRYNGNIDESGIKPPLTNREKSVTEEKISKNKHFDQIYVIIYKSRSKEK